MHSDMGIRDRFLIRFFGWVTGMRLLNPSKDPFTDQEEGIRGATPAYIPLMEESDTIH